MRFFVDESLSVRVAKLIAAAGHDAVHVADRGMLGASDPDVMRVASDERRVLISADTDFGELLALGRHPGPSVIIFRHAPHRPEQQASVLLSALPDLADSLDEGAVVSLTRDTARVRTLPIDPEGRR